MQHLIEAFLFIAVLPLISTTTHQVFYVSPDNSTNTSCSFQPCATLSQYLLDNNGSLPVVSNVEYHFLPGEHYVTKNLTLQNLHSFIISGSSSDTFLSTEIVIEFQSYIKIISSVNVTVANVIHKSFNDIEYGINRHGTCNVMLNNCISCKIINVMFLDYGLCCEDLGGTSYLSSVMVDFTKQCYTGISLAYKGDTQIDDHEHMIVMDRILMIGNGDHCEATLHSTIKAGIQVLLPSKSVSTMIFIIKNSQFQSMGQAIISINSSIGTTNNTIRIHNCKFMDNTHDQIFVPLINISFSPSNITFTISNSQFFRNQGFLISIKASKNDNFCKFPVIATIKYCKFVGNEGLLLRLSSSELAPCVKFVFNGRIDMHWNIGEDKSMYFVNWFVHINGHLRIYNSQYTVMDVRTSYISFNGLMTVMDNLISTAVMKFRSSYVLFNGQMILSYNEASVIILMYLGHLTFNGQMAISNNNASFIMQIHSGYINFNGLVRISNNNHLCMHIMQFQFCNIMFSKIVFITSNYCDRIITVKAHRESAYIQIMEYSNFTLTQNIYKSLIAVETDPAYNNPYPFCLFQYVSAQNESVILPSHYTIIISDNIVDKCTLNYNHFTSHCEWMSTAVFHDQNPRDINQQIIQVDHTYQHTVIFLCSNFNIYDCALGPVYPGQTLQVEFCMPCSVNLSVLYAETHNAILPKSACKIAHQNELVNFITNNFKLVNYTIVSEVNDSCELFLTVSPFLYYIYEVFDVQLLPCPIGFTLQNGVCDCDPLLPTDIDICYIDQSAIRRPANTWISYTQSGTSKYLISDCPMDYCLPFSSNVNLLHPDTQCQFSRTGILCSQCQHHLSMVFGSSRCMKCTNVHILITIIIIVAGVVLVLLLYLLNLTVTNATINGIILYANAISINNSAFLINDQIFKPLQIFISFANLDLGVETCFYNGMDGYAKIWLQLCFPVYLIFMAFSIIIASRYSSRILRLTYRRSLPVLATLFLLSYTSVLRTVLTVLFSYSTITHVPSGHQELVWSVDASVPLFGLKFTILFITCLVLFLILLFFNIILLFTRCLSRFKLINYFKPILDAFQGSYKDRYYQWVAVHIILRSLFFAFYVFTVKLRLLIATMVLVTFSCTYGYIRPNKSRIINFQELLLLINLTILHAVSYYSNDNVFGITTNLMISLSFIQFCVIVIYHLLTYTCHFNIENTLNIVKMQLLKYRRKENQLINFALLNIPDRTYNYSEYQDGLVSEDFAANS